MMNNLKSACVMCLIHSLWCVAFGVVAYVLYFVTNVVIFCAIFPTMMFYSLYFWYDASERWVYRKLNIVRILR